MKCPHCNKDLVVPDYALCSMQSYRKTVNIKTDCCGKIVMCIPKTSFNVFATDLAEDDWGDTCE